MAAKTPKVSRSLRVDPRMWEKARHRAESEGYNLNEAMGLLLEGYAQGRINTPRIVKQYAKQR